MLILLAIPLVPVAMTVAILRHQLLDIRLVVSRAVLYGLLTAGVIGVYVGLVAVLDVLLRRQVGLGTSRGSQAGADAEDGPPCGHSADRWTIELVFTQVTRGEAG